MKKVKRLIALATCVVLASSTALTSCSNSDGGSASKGGKPVTLTWYAIGDEPSDVQLVEDEANKYLEEKINAKIDMKFIGFGDYTQKMSVIMNSGEPFDLAFTCSWAGDYVGNARKGAFLELDEYIDEFGKDMKETIDQRFWDGAKVNGKTYAVPNQKELGVAPTWAFTKEYVDKYNIPYETLHSLEDLEPWLKVIKENEPGVVPLYTAQGFSYTVAFDLFVANAFGINVNDENLEVVNIFETDEMKEKLKTLERYYEAGYINADSAITKDDKNVKRLVTKQDGHPHAEAIWSQDLGYDIVASPITDAMITSASTTGGMIGVGANSKNPEKSVEFLNLLNTDEYLRNLINYGIEDVHYEKIGDKQIKKIKPELARYNVSAFALGNVFLTYLLENEPETKWADYEEFNNESKISPALGFQFNDKNVRNELAALNNILEEFKQTLYSGSVDVDEYLGKLNTKLKEQGSDKVIAEMQSQLDEWNNNK